MIQKQVEPASFDFLSNPYLQPQRLCIRTLLGDHYTLGTSTTNYFIHQRVEPTPPVQKLKLSGLAGNLRYVAVKQA